jgi:hypothetical protein
MKTLTVDNLAKRIEELEERQTALLEALKLLLPIAISIPASTPDSAQAIKELKAGLEAVEGTTPQTEDFWYLASAMAMLLSSKAKAQHPSDAEVIRIYQGIRSHRKQ